jgi:seryl-tRNA synthetase
VVEIVGDQLEGPQVQGHEALAASLGLADFEAASRVVGSKFVYLRGAAAMLEMALQHWAVQQVPARPSVCCCDDCEPTN